MAIEIEKVSSDNRGDVYRYDVGDRQHVIVTFGEAGIARGGHYHETGQWHICLAGKLKVKFYNLETKEEMETVMQEGHSVFIHPKVAHLFTAEEPSVLAESRVGDYEATDYEPYRSLARPQ